MTNNKKIIILPDLESKEERRENPPPIFSISQMGSLPNFPDDRLHSLSLSLSSSDICVSKKDPKN